MRRRFRDAERGPALTLLAREGQTNAEVELQAAERDAGKQHTLKAVPNV